MGGLIDCSLKWLNRPLRAAPPSIVTETNVFNFVSSLIWLFLGRWPPYAYREELNAIQTIRLTSCFWGADIIDSRGCAYARRQ